MYRVMGIPTVCNKRVQIWCLLGMLLGSMLISGCGQKGPLRLPPPPPEENQPNQNDTLPAATLNLVDTSSNISTDISSGKSKAE